MRLPERWTGLVAQARSSGSPIGNRWRALCREETASDFCSLTVVWELDSREVGLFSIITNSVAYNNPDLLLSFSSGS